MIAEVGTDVEREYIALLLERQGRSRSTNARVRAGVVAVTDRIKELEQANPNLTRKLHRQFRG